VALQLRGEGGHLLLKKKKERSVSSKAVSRGREEGRL
jgi:hypothetical protein